MRTIEELREAWDASKASDKMLDIGQGLCVWMNASIRDALREEYISLQPLERQLACWLVNHSKDKCYWDAEIYGLEDAWGEYVHAVYVNKASKMLDLVKGDINLIKELISVYLGRDSHTEGYL